jgi:hypothetical protein
VAPWTANLFEKEIRRVAAVDTADAVDIADLVVLMIPVTTYRSFQSTAKKMAMVTKSSMSYGKRRRGQKSTTCPAIVPLAAATATVTRSPLSRIFGDYHSAAVSLFVRDTQMVL